MRVSGKVAALVLLAVACKGKPQSRPLTDTSRSDAAHSAPPVESARPATASERALAVLRKGERVELLALDGDRADVTEHLAAGEVGVPSPPGAFIATPVIDSVVLTDESEKERARAAALQGLGDEATAGWCFKPRHALRVTQGAEVVTLVLSYECASAWLVGPGVHAHFAINQGSDRSLNEVLGTHQVPPFGSAPVSPDRVEPVPAEIPYLRVPLPRSTRNYYAYAEGLQHTLLQLRFELPAADAKRLERRLPCRLGAEQTGPPEQAIVGSNDRNWYRAERVKKHRGCQYHHDLRTAEFLFDLDDPARVIVYAVISSE